MKHSFKVVLGVLLIVSVLLAPAPRRPRPRPVVVRGSRRDQGSGQGSDERSRRDQGSPGGSHRGAPTPVPTPTIPPPVLTDGEGCAPAATKITWYIGLGAGTNADVIPAEKAWVDKFNKSQTEACVLLNVVYNTGTELV